MRQSKQLRFCLPLDFESFRSLAIESTKDELRFSSPLVVESFRNLAFKSTTSELLPFLPPMLERFRHLSFKSTEVLAAKISGKSFLITAHFSPYLTKPSTRADVSSSLHRRFCRRGAARGVCDVAAVTARAVTALLTGTAPVCSRELMHCAALDASPTSSALPSTLLFSMSGGPSFGRATGSQVY